MKILVRLGWTLGLSAMLLPQTLPNLSAAEPAKVLVVTTTVGFRHSSIPTAEKVLAKLAEETGAFTLDYARQPGNQPSPPRKPKDEIPGAEAAFKKAQADYEAAKAAWDKELAMNLSKLSPENLKNYRGVIFANTTGDLPLPSPQGFIDWIKAGGAFVGMHSASDTFHGFKPYIEMLGGEFETHGAQATVDCINQDPAHPACKHLNNPWTIHDEIYIIKSFNRSQVHGLLTLDKHPNKKTPGDYPIAWNKQVGQGKVFYTSLGHREDVWENPVYQQHILGGIKWALGLVPGDARPQQKEP